MKRVLIVDDEPELTDVVREYLQADYDVVVANSGAAALASFRQNGPTWSSSTSTCRDRAA